MRYLLDTHIWHWMLAEPERLQPGVALQLGNPENELWVSAVSIWELILLARKGRVDLGDDPVATLRRALREIPVRDGALSREIVFTSRTIDLPHQDPADRFIAATAKVLGLVLVTQDEQMLACPEIEVLANRERR